MSRAHDWAGAVLALVLCLGLPVAVAAEGEADPIGPGSLVTYTDQTGARWCATVSVLFVGIADIPAAWVLINADRRRVFQGFVRDLSRGCL